jgi:uncharacterized membrane protein YGL010W
MNTIQDWFDAYGQSHRNKVNKAIHWICVPLIFYSLIGILSLVSFGFLYGLVPESLIPYLHLGTVLMLFGIVFFLRLSRSIALGMVVVSVIILYLVHSAHLSFGADVWKFFVGIFVVSWIGQFIGHKIEGAKPSFFDDLKFLMIGPAWLLHFIYRKVGLKY